MLQVFKIILLLQLWLMASLTSAGIVQSFLHGLHSIISTTAANGPSPSPSTEQTAISNADGYLHINHSSVSVPIANGSQLRVDLCEGDIVVALSFDVQKEKVIESTGFPFQRSTPVICMWRVRATTNCRRGFITMTIHQRSRLADVDGCLKGYYTVSPFMGQAKICGRVNSVPTFGWYVDHDQPENVTITLRHLGLNDGYSEGLSFNLSGECRPNSDNTTVSQAWQSYANWLQQISTATWTGAPTVVLPSTASSATVPSISDESALFQEAVEEQVSTKTTTTTTTLSPDLEQENVTLPMHPTHDSSEVLLLPATPGTQLDGHDDLVGVQLDGHAVVMATDVVGPTKVESTLKVDHSDSHISWLILKTGHPNEFGPKEKKKTSSSQPDRAQVDSILIDDTMKSADMSLHSNTNEPTHHARPVDVGLDESATPWIIYARPMGNIQRAPLTLSPSPIVRPKSPFSNVKEILHNDDQVSSEMHVQSEEQPADLSSNRRVETATPSIYSSSSATENPRRHDVTLPRRRNPLLAFDD